MKRLAGVATVLFLVLTSVLTSAFAQTLDDLKNDGKQYVTVLSGLGGIYFNQARGELKNVPQGGSVWTFALLPE